MSENWSSLSRRSCNASRRPLTGPGWIGQTRLQRGRYKMSDLYESLAWLPRPPANFASLCRTVLDAAEALGDRLQWLASHALDEAQLNQLAKQVARSRVAGHPLASLAPFKLGVISNTTTDFICPALVATALRHGIALECIAAPFGQVAQQALSADSEIRRARPDAVLIAVDF